MTLLAGYDATRTLVESGSIPANPPVVAGYLPRPPGVPAAAGIAWIADDWARFPSSVKVTVATHPGTDADILDIETFDAAPSDFPAWYDRQMTNPPLPFGLRRALVRPGYYCNRSTWPAVESLVGPSRRPVAWIAAPGLAANLIPGANAVQYAWTPGYDRSVWDSTVLAGVDPPAPPSGTFSATSTPVGGDLLYSIQFPTDGNGNGWSQTAIPWAKFQAATLRGSDPAVDGYWHGSCHVQDRDNNVLVSVTDFLPNSTAIVFVWAAA